MIRDDHIISATDGDKWLVVDGLQRLTTLKSFILDNTLKLCELEFFSSFIGKTYADLPRPMQRRINDTQVTVYLIERGTPSRSSLMFLSMLAFNCYFRY